MQLSGSDREQDLRPSRRCSGCVSIGFALLAALPSLSLARARSVGSDDTVEVATTAELEHALGAAKPGQSIAVAAGDYPGFSIRGVCGEAMRPIVVRAAVAEQPPRFRSGVQLSACSFVELDALVFEGSQDNGLNVDDGSRLDQPARGIKLRRLAIRDCGGDGNHDGLKLSGVTEFEVVDCTIERWGKSGSAIDCVGCSEGRIVGSTFRGEADAHGGSGVQMKGGSREITVRGCRFEHAGERAVNLGGSTGLPYFRPKPQGFEAKELVVEGCTIVGSLAPIAFVGCDGAVVRFNTIVDPGKWVVRVLQETQSPDFVPCRNGSFTGNLIVYDAAHVRTALNVGPATAVESFTFARNYWFCRDAPGQSVPQLPITESEAHGGEDPCFAAPEKGDYRVARGSPARRFGADAAAPAPAKR